MGVCCVVACAVKAGAVSQQEIGSEKEFKVPERLLKFKERMKEKEGQYLEQFHGIGGDTQINQLYCTCKNLLVCKCNFHSKDFFKFNIDSLTLDNGLRRTQGVCSCLAKHVTSGQGTPPLIAQRGSGL